MKTNGSASQDVRDELRPVPEDEEGMQQPLKPGQAKIVGAKTIGGRRANRRRRAESGDRVARYFVGRPARDDGKSTLEQEVASEAEGLVIAFKKDSRVYFVHEYRVTQRIEGDEVRLEKEPVRQRLPHTQASDHPTGEWTLQQFREALPDDHPYRFLIHDRDSIFSQDLDKALSDMGVRILRTPVRAPLASSICERLVGTARRECLDFLFPLGERHLRRTLQLWIDHYSRDGPHMGLGPGIPVPFRTPPPSSTHRHHLPAGQVVRSRPVLGGLHHEHRLDEVAA